MDGLYSWGMVGVVEGGLVWLRDGGYSWGRVGIVEGWLVQLRECWYSWGMVGIVEGRLVLLRECRYGWGRVGIVGAPTRDTVPPPLRRQTKRCFQVIAAGSSPESRSSLWTERRSAWATQQRHLRTSWMWFSGGGLGGSLVGLATPTEPAKTSWLNACGICVLGQSWPSWLLSMSSHTSS